MQTRTIDIDFEVHKAIELERRSFAETPNAVLRRVLGIDPAELKQAKAPPSVSAAAIPSADAYASEGRPWVGKGKSTGLVLPHGTELRMDYNGQRFTGRVDNGSLVIEGRRFSSPSGAADELCRTKDGRKTSLNGKELIHVRIPGEGEYVLLKTYEQRLR